MGADNLGCATALASFGLRAAVAPISGDTMGILSRYILRQVAGALLLIILSLTGVVWIAVALRQIELVTNQGRT